MSPNTENDAPDMILCVFPNAHKVLLLSSKSESNTEFALDSDFIFGEHFYSSVEAKINGEIRSNNFHPLSGNGIPEKVENIVREATISSILEALNDKIGKSISQDSISIFFFSGQVLNFSNSELSQAVMAIYGETVSGSMIEDMVKQLISLSSEEKELLEKSKNNELYSLITGQQGEFATIWDKDNII